MPLQLTTVSEGVHRLATRYENLYVLESGGRLTLLDAGLSDSVKAAGERAGHRPQRSGGRLGRHALQNADVQAAERHLEQADRSATPRVRAAAGVEAAT